MVIRKAKLSEAKIIHRLIEEGGEDGFLLPRALSEIYEKIRDYWVGVEGDEVVMVCALHPVWEDLAEIRSLVVDRKWRGKGWGRKLVKKAEEEAKELGVKRVFVLTASPSYFEKLGYRKISKRKLPHKVWRDCLNCPYFPNCKEEALIKDL